MFNPKNLKLIKIIPGTKRPMEEGWPTYTYDQLQTQTSIGIPCGIENNLTVVDVDGPDGHKVMDYLLEKYVMDGDLDTYISPTPSGGYHMYFKYNPKFKNNVRLIVGCDIRTQGGQVLMYNKEDGSDPIDMPLWLENILLSGIGVVKEHEGRNNALNKYLFKLRKDNISIDRGEYESTAKEFCVIHTTPDYSEAGQEYRNTVESAWNARIEQVVVPVGQGFNIISSNDMVDMTIPPIPWLVEGIVAEKKMMILGGRAKVGKSTFAQWLCKQITGSLYISEEMGLEDILPRDRGIVGQTVDYSILAKSKLTTEWMDKLTELIMAKKYKFVVIDSLRRVHQGSEQESELMDAALGLSKEVVNKTGCSIMFIHHLKKGNLEDCESVMDMLRGSSDIAAIMDSPMIMTRSGDQVKVMCDHRYYKNTYYIYKMVGCEFELEGEGSNGLELSRLESRNNIIKFLQEHPQGSVRSDLQDAKLLGVMGKYEFNKLVKEGLIIKTETKMESRDGKNRKCVLLTAKEAF